MKKIFLVIILFTFCKVNAQQFLNGDFSGYPANVGNECNPPGNGWSFGGLGGVSGPQLTTHQNGGNYYIDLTPCKNKGNNSMIYQGVNFSSNTQASISLDLRPLRVSNGNHDAGVKILMDGNLIGKVSNANMGTWATVSTPVFNVTAGTHRFTFIGDANISNADIIGVDNISINVINCCPGKNLICNGGFEEGKNCSESQYQFNNQQPFKPGNYTITGYDKAPQLCKNWVFDNAPCQRSGNAMFVNGVTNGQGSKIIWQQTVSFNAWKQYRFCADVYAFTQCCFNVTPTLKFTLSYKSGGQTKTVLLDEIKPDGCGWVKYTKNIAQWEGNDGGNATVTITLDENGIGDGNDFAIDNIALIQLEPLPKSVTNSASVTPNANGSITGSFTGDLTAYSNSGFGWYVVPLDNNGQPDASCPEINNPQQWWTANTNFAGFNGCGLNGNAPGKLTPGKSYKFILGTFGFCYAWDAVVFNVKYDPATQKVVINKDEKSDERNPIFKKLAIKPLEVPLGKSKN